MPACPLRHCREFKAKTPRCILLPEACGPLLCTLSEALLLHIGSFLGTFPRGHHGEVPPERAGYGVLRPHAVPMARGAGSGGAAEGGVQVLATAVRLLALTVQVLATAVGLLALTVQVLVQLPVLAQR